MIIVTLQPDMTHSPPGGQSVSATRVARYPVPAPGCMHGWLTHGHSPVLSQRGGRARDGRVSRVDGVGFAGWIE